MDDTAEILMTAVKRMLREQRERWLQADTAAWPAQAWAAVEDMGLPLALIDTDSGGFGLSPRDALQIVRIAAAEAAPLPIGESMLAAALLARAGVALPHGAMTVGLSGDLTLTRQERGAHQLRGRCERVPCGRHVKWVVLLADLGDDTAIVLTPANELQWSTGENLAGESRDTLHADLTVGPDRWGKIGKLETIAQRSLGAMLRCQSLAGAIERVLAMTVEYAGERVQFGRKIGTFQAIQHALAAAAGHSVASTAAADLAAEAYGTGDPLPIAIAKVRCGEAAGAVAATAHQIHGALGFSAEHPLHRYTKRLWAWREEYGREAAWAELVGRTALDAGADGVWPMLARL